MRTLEFIVEKQVITKNRSCDFSNIVSGTKGYLKTSFVFSVDWLRCKKVAVFSTVKSEKIAVPIQNGECEIPTEVLNGSSFFINVIGEKDGLRLTTNKIKVEQERVN